MNIHKDDIETYVHERMINENDSYEKIYEIIYNEILEIYDLDENKKNEVYVIQKILQNIID